MKRKVSGFDLGRVCRCCLSRKLRAIDGTHNQRLERTRQLATSIVVAWASRSSVTLDASRLN